MADTSLDDFFAKKDKSKKKTKSKKTDVDDVSKVKKKEKKKDKDNSGGGLNSLKPKDEEEWKDFEEEKEVDLKGLRIQNMQIGKDDLEKDAASAEDEDDSEDCDNTDRKRGVSGPWKQIDGQANNVKAKKEKPVVATPEPKKEEISVPKSTGKYVPPGARYTAVTNNTPSNFNSRRKKEAPNMNSEDDFPTLGGGLAPRSYSSSNSGDLIDNPRGKAGNVTLENRFSTLQD